MNGDSMLKFAPLHLSAHDRSPSLIQWIKSWIPVDEITLLKPEDWFTLGHGLDGGHNNDDNMWIPTYDNI